MGQTGAMSDSLPEPSSYAATLVEIKQQVHAARFKAQRRANTELVELYWRIGRTIAARQATEGWGARVISRLADDLRASFPEMKGFSSRNLSYMRAFAVAWSDHRIVQQAVAQLPRGHITVLLDRLGDPALRAWYADKAVAQGRSRNVLEYHIKTSAHERFEAAPSNFGRVLVGGHGYCRPESGPPGPARTKESQSWFQSPR